MSRSGLAAAEMKPTQCPVCGRRMVPKCEAAARHITEMAGKYGTMALWLLGPLALECPEHASHLPPKERG